MTASWLNTAPGRSVNVRSAFQIRQIPDSREKGEKVAWYVGGDDGCLYYCDREFGNKQPFAKSDRVRLERWDADSGEGTMTLDKNSEVKVWVIIEESLRPE